MNVQHYRKRLLDIEKDLSARMERASRSAGELVPELRGDVGDASVADVAASDHFTETELDGAVLAQVRDALVRIDNGTFGKCVFDGGPIETKRLEAVPWSPYCLKHQSLLEAAAQPRVFTL